jgi:hypothetical protein
MGSRFTELLYGFSVYRVVLWVLGLQSCCMGSLFTELLYGFSVYRVVVWVFCLQSCCMGSRNPYNNSVNREPIQQLCKPRTHTTTLSTENPYNNSINREPIQQVLGLQSCCMGSRFTELLYGFSVYRVGVWVLG